MNTIQRLAQYQKLYSEVGDRPCGITARRLAEIFCCSERHVRTIIRHFEQQRWITWQAHSGRGKQAQLQCLHNPETLKQQFIQQMLRQGSPQSALRLAHLDTDDLQHLLMPHMGGQWQAESPTLRIPFYRELTSLYPLNIRGRAEKHLAHNIYAGLTRFVTDNPYPQPDLAHHWTHDAHGTRWDFMLHTGLHWHNGQPMSTEQILQILRQLADDARSKSHFHSVKQISSPHPLCIRFELHRADYWLPYRLAKMQCLLTHPRHPEMGAGPFKLSLFTSRLLRLEKHPYYHLRHPYLNTIECWIDPLQSSGENEENGSESARILIGKPPRHSPAQPIQRQTSLGFCYLAVNLKRKWLRATQAQQLQHFIHHSGITSRLPVEHGIISPTDSLLPGWPLPAPAPADLALPQRLTLLYPPQPELKMMAFQLRRELEAHGYQLRLLAVRHGHQQAQLAQADLLLGDRLVGDAPEATLESWLRQDMMWPAFLAEQDAVPLYAALDHLQGNSDPQWRNQQLKTLYLQLMQQGYLTPLFNYQYQVSTPNRVNDIKLTAYGWFDFCQAWVPPVIEN
ncbi:SgrR family transcriptional regulator [Paramixta manurensis]|uniref:SgrR family transcriptional regulator n=1 Tax=Paramixta manurensis TaxID=2740817 RepID=A0A6M8UCR2_9GAMM|nr:SgrR family transcriptional regulator [Erwiniaceae bacterium PD-1]